MGISDHLYTLYHICHLIFAEIIKVTSCKVSSERTDMFYVYLEIQPHIFP